MLADKDRIFTNLYGLHDWRLEGARKRGDWDGTVRDAFGVTWLIGYQASALEEAAPGR